MLLNKRSFQRYSTKNVEIPVELSGKSQNLRFRRLRKYSLVDALRLQKNENQRYLSVKNDCSKNKSFDVSREIKSFEKFRPSKPAGNESSVNQHVDRIFKKSLVVFDSVKNFNSNINCNQSFRSRAMKKISTFLNSITDQKS